MDDGENACREDADEAVVGEDDDPVGTPNADVHGFDGGASGSKEDTNAGAAIVGRSSTADVNMCPSYRPHESDGTSPFLSSARRVWCRGWVGQWSSAIRGDDGRSCSSSTCHSAGPIPHPRPAALPAPPPKSIGGEPIVDEGGLSMMSGILGLSRPKRKPPALLDPEVETEPW